MKHFPGSVKGRRIDAAGRGRRAAALLLAAAVLFGQSSIAAAEETDAQQAAWQSVTEADPAETEVNGTVVSGDGAAQNTGTLELRSADAGKEESTGTGTATSENTGTEATVDGGAESGSVIETEEVPQGENPEDRILFTGEYESEGAEDIDSRLFAREADEAAAEESAAAKVTGQMEMIATVDGFTPNYAGRDRSENKRNTVWVTGIKSGEKLVLRARVNNVDAGTKAKFEWTSNKTTTPFQQHPNQKAKKDSGTYYVEDTVTVPPVSASTDVFGYFCTVTVDDQQMNKFIDADRTFVYIVQNPLQIETGDKHLHIRKYDNNTKQFGTVVLEVDASSKLSGDKLPEQKYMWTVSNNNPWLPNVTSDNTGKLHTAITVQMIDDDTTTVVCKVSSAYSPDAVYGKRIVTFTIDTSQHTYTGWKVVKDATIWDRGFVERTCEVCGYKETQEVAKLTPAISANMATIPIQAGGNTSLYKVSLEEGDYIAKWESSDRSVCTVVGRQNGTCLIRTTGKKGRATITATAASGLTVSAQVRVQKKKVKTKAIAGLPESVTLKKGGKRKLSPVLTPLTSQSGVTYRSSKPGIAAVSAKGRIRAKAPGRCTVTVTSGKIRVKIPVTVTGVDTTAIRGVKSAYTMRKGKTRQLKVKLRPVNATSRIRYTSSNRKVVKVSKTGKLTARRKGTAVITIRAVNLESETVTRQITVTVK